MKILLLGATGLVGKELLRQLEAHPSVREISVLLRREPPEELRRLCRKTTFSQTDFSRIPESHPCLSANVIVSALGTTIKKAGSPEAFRAVDYGIPLTVATFARRKGATQCFLVSALGADENSGIFYNRVKGELERDLRALHFPKLVILRPSVLVGRREESRPLEAIAQEIGKFLPKKWRAVPAENVARTITKGLIGLGSGEHMVENAGLFS